MRTIGISNIAWTAGEDEAAYELLASLGVTSLELAPTRYWPVLDAPAAGEPERKAAEFRGRGFEVTSFQAILFGQPELLLFDASTRPGLLKYLRGVADLCAAMGARTMVFGAPKNRLVPEGMDAAEARGVAVEFFRELSAYAVKRGVVFGLEANPAAYGCNFCTHVDEAAAIVRAVDSPGLRWHLDTGEMAMNDEEVEAILDRHGELAGSAHISEPNLGGFSTPWAGHRQVAKWLAAAHEFPISIEMKRQPEGLAAVGQAVRTAGEIYA